MAHLLLRLRDLRGRLPLRGDRKDQLLLQRKEEENYIGWIDHFILSLPRLWSQPFLRGALVLLVGGIIIERDLSARGTCCYRNVSASRTFQLLKLERTHTQIHTHTHKNAHICTSIHTYTYFRIHEFTAILSILVHLHRDLPCLLSLGMTFLPQ